jgi:hypothetical protein
MVCLPPPGADTAPDRPEPSRRRWLRGPSPARSSQNAMDGCAPIRATAVAGADAAGSTSRAPGSTAGTHRARMPRPRSGSLIAELKRADFRPEDFHDCCRARVEHPAADNAWGRRPLATPARPASAKVVAGPPSTGQRSPTRPRESPGTRRSATGHRERHGSGDARPNSRPPAGPQPGPSAHPAGRGEGPRPLPLSAQASGGPRDDRQAVLDLRRGRMLL